MAQKKKPILISACLIGINCRYDGTNALNKKLIKRYAKECLIPVCPEQLGGLPTPRLEAKIRGKDVIDKSGRTLTREFKKGAKEVLKIAKLLDAKKAVLKEKSPSCGVKLIYKNGKLVKGQGITTRLLAKNGVDTEGVK